MILNMTAGGTAGCVLTVTAPAGAVVTASRDGKTLTKTAASGTAVFRGLETGEWVLTMTDGEQISQPQTVTVKNDYAAELTFFAATIHVTYPEGSTCTVSDGVTTLNAPDTSGVWACTVPNAGTWTFTVAENGWSDAVEISSHGQTASVYLDAYYLYREGNEYTKRTGGMLIVTTGTLTKENDRLYLKADDEVGYFRFANLLDTSGFSTLKATITYRYAENGGSLNLKCASNAAFTETIAHKQLSDTGDVTVPLDGIRNAYIGFSLYLGEIRVSKVWLE